MNEEEPAATSVERPWIAVGELEGYENQLVGNVPGLERLRAAIEQALVTGTGELELSAGRVTSVVRIDEPRQALGTKRPSSRDWLGAALSLLVTAVILTAACLVLLWLWRWLVAIF